MKLYLCTRLSGGGWDSHAGMVVRAESYGAARRALKEALPARERDDPWKVARLREDGTPGVVIKDYVAG